MILNRNLGRKLGHSNRLALLGLAMTLGISLPAEARNWLSPEDPVMPLGNLQTAPAMAMGHGSDDHEADDHEADDHGADDHEADDHGADDHEADDHGADDHGAEQPGEEHPSADPDSDNPSQSSPSSASPVELITASHGNHFTVGFPQDWVITHAEISPLLKAQSPVDPSLTTDVSWYPEAPGQVFAALLADIQAQGHTVVRYDAIAMDDTTAIRLWLTDLPASEPAYAFISVVGYGSATAVLVSRYETRSSDLEDLLSQIHQSFRHGSPATTPDHHHP
ncbi:MAG: hypothetical protein VKI82_08730 [Leptolyngbya sp.]|nr:hypothetical protein [Leptolyngbya sp.]